MINFKTLLFVSAIAVFSSCTRLYTPALYQQDIAYLPKPASWDTIRSSTYISGGYDAYSNGNLADYISSFQANVSQGYVFNYFNVAWGAFGVIGDYQNGTGGANEPFYFSDRVFGAYGGRASVNLFTTSGRVDIRYIGVEASYSHEFGQYAAYRQLVANQPGFYADPRTTLFTIGVTTEVIFHNRDNNDFEHGVRGFLGITQGRNLLNEYNNSQNGSTQNGTYNVFPKVSYFINYKKYFATVEAGENFFIRVGCKF